MVSKYRQEHNNLFIHINIQDSLPFTVVLSVVIPGVLSDTGIICFAVGNLKLKLCNKTSKAKKERPWNHTSEFDSAWARQSTPADEWLAAADDLYRATPRFCDTGPRCWGLVRLYDRTLSNVNTQGGLCKIFTDTKGSTSKSLITTYILTIYQMVVTRALHINP